MNAIDVLTHTLTSAENWIIIGLSTFLGKVWARRIADREEAEIKKDIVQLESKLQQDSERLSKDIQHQNDLYQQAIQNASVETNYIFQKRCDAVMDLWSRFQLIKKECSRFFTPHQILLSSEKSTPKAIQTFGVSTPITEAALKKIMEHQEAIICNQPLIPLQIYNLFNGLITFYARLALNHMFSLPKGHIPTWFYMEKGKVDYSVQQLHVMSRQLGLQLPELNDDPPGFDSWKSVFEHKLVEDITQFINGSLKRQIEMQQELKTFSNTDIAEAKQANL